MRRRARILLLFSILTSTSCRETVFQPPEARLPQTESSMPAQTHVTPSPPAQSPAEQPDAAADNASQSRESGQNASPIEPTPATMSAPQKGVKPRGKPKFSRKSAIYDRNGPAYALLQSARQALGRFPADNLGNIDWVEALELGLIAPRATVSGNGHMRSRTDEIVMRNTRDMPWVAFPHRQHTEWLACSNCHPRPFKEKSAANVITMDNIMRGEQCGVCHDRVAFSIFACERCHSVTHPGSPKPWW